MSFGCASRQLFLSLEWALLAVSSILSPSKSWISSKINQQFPSERTDSNSAVYQWRGRRRCYTLGSMNEQPVVAAIYERVNHRFSNIHRERQQETTKTPAWTVIYPRERRRTNDWVQCRCERKYSACVRVCVWHQSVPLMRGSAPAC